MDFNKNEIKVPKTKKKRTHRKVEKKTAKKEVMDGILVKNIPINYSIDQFVDYFRHCGIAKKISPTQFDAFFLNENLEQKNKEGTLYFLHEESVQKALEYYDNSQIEPGYIIHIEAIFSTHDNSNQNKRIYNQKREEEWDDQNLVHVVIKNMFDLESPKEIKFFRELKEDVENEVNVKCGPFEKVTIFENNPEGVVIIKFKNHESAEKCIALMNGRWFDKKQLLCDYYDGFTNYRIAETEEEKKKRIEKWEEFIENNSE